MRDKKIEIRVSGQELEQITFNLQKHNQDNKTEISLSEFVRHLVVGTQLKVVRTEPAVRTEPISHDNKQIARLSSKVLIPVKHPISSNSEAIENFISFVRSIGSGGMFTPDQEEENFKRFIQHIKDCELPHNKKKIVDDFKNRMKLEYE